MNTNAAADRGVTVRSLASAWQTAGYSAVGSGLIHKNRQIMRSRLPMLRRAKPSSAPEKGPRLITGHLDLAAVALLGALADVTNSMR